ncbi:MAG: ArsR family transcriptional regulator [Methanomassiliicoccales archaeon]|nr:MAG: ArsR family transcriptional regulator [Methanomassiliicoccales archaeon]
MVNPEGLHAIMDPIGMRILLELNRRPEHVSELARKLESPRPTVAYHLGIMEKLGILRSEYKIFKEGNPKGRVARVYSIDKRVLKKYLQETKKLFEIVE